MEAARCVGGLWGAGDTLHQIQPFTSKDPGEKVQVLQHTWVITLGNPDAFACSSP